MSYVILLPFAEPEGVLAADVLGNLDDLYAEPAVTAPLVVTAWTGRGRSFNGTTMALIAADRSQLGTILTRDMTVQALISISLAGVTQPMTLIMRGTADRSPSERYAYGLRIERHPYDAGLVLVSWIWQSSDDQVHTTPPGVFRSPGDGKAFLLTATRRWESSSRVVVRYFVNDDLIAELPSEWGDIAGGTLGRTTVGARKAAGIWLDFFSGVIDELAVTDYEMSLEEVRHTWKRLTEYQPGGVSTFSQLCPPGLGWADDPGNSMGRLVKVVGQGLGLAVAAAEELRALWMPDVANQENAARWESFLKLAPKPRDSLDVRRARLVGYGSRLQGFSIPAVLQTVAPLLAATPEQLQVIEYDNIVRDGFATFDTASKWLVGDVGTWTAVGGQLQLNVPTGTDLRWSAYRQRAHARLDPDFAAGFVYVSTKLLDYGTIPASTSVGILLSNRRTWNHVFYGVRNNAGTLELGWQRAKDGIEGPWNLLQTFAVGFAGPLWLRVQTRVGTGLSGVGPMDFSMSTAGPNSGFTVYPSVTTGVTDIEWAGYAALSSIASPIAAVAAKFDDFEAYAPNGARSFAWYIYRDPAIPGVPDVNSATALIRRLKPAHTFGGFTQSTKLLAGSNRDGRAYSVPLGVW